MDLIFFERQQAALCAQHALNMLLQGDYFSASDLAEIARRLDQEENIVLDPNLRNSRSVNMDDHGYFSVQVGNFVIWWCEKIVRYIHFEINRF